MQTEKELWRRVIAMILTLVLLFSLTPGAISSNAASTEQLSDEDKLSMIAAGILKPVEVFGELDPDTVPEAIDYEDAVSKNHIERLYADEGTDLNTVVFLNIDGTKTRYTFDYPVKYVDADGSIKDISLQIADTEEGYQTAENAVITTFSENISDGIILSDDETNIKLIPVLPVQTTIADALGDEEYSNMYYPVSMATRLDDRTIQYYYDSNTTIEYSLTYTGYKEDIVVSEYTGQTQYEFILLTNGYCVSCIDGSYYLVDENQQIRASVGEIIVFTADERNNTFGDIMVETIVEGEEYRMAIVLDAEYLSDPNTVYPIRIDPTIEINYNNNGAGAIEDVTINSNAVSNGYNNVLYVGSHEIDGISRILMKFPGLDLDALGENVEIQSATVSIRDLMCESDPLEVYCHVYTGASWTETTANGTDNAPGGIGTFLSATTISYEIGASMPSSHRYSFDITKAVRGWYDGIYDQDKGIILKAHAIAESGTDYIRKTIGSYNRGSYVPILTVTYSIGGNQLLPNNTYYLNNLYTGNYLKIDAGTGNNIGVQSGLLEKLGTSIQWKIEKQQRGYVIRSVEHPDCYLAVPSDVSQEDVVVVPNLYSDIPEECFWKITVSSMGGCILQSAYNNRYLRSISETIKCATSTGSAGGILHCGSTWRIIETDKYTNVSISRYRELTSYSSFEDVEMNVGHTAEVQINRRFSNEIWCEPSDFNYTYSHLNAISVSRDYSNGTASLNASKRDVVIVTATHKVTKRKMSFEVFVQNSTLTDEEKNAIRTSFKQVINNDYVHSSLYNTRTFDTSINIVLDYDDIITDYCNQYRIPKEYVQSVLLREVWCESYLDYASDAAVKDYYNYKISPDGIIRPIEKTDSSTGLGQIFASTAIKAINNANARGFITNEPYYETSSWQDVWEVWSKLHGNVDFNLQCCALVILDCQYEYKDSIAYEEFFLHSETQIKTILARYNGYGDEAANYGEICYEYFKIFKSYN